MRLFQAEDVSDTIRIPTIHAWSLDDVDYPRQSAQLVQMCDRARCVEVVHGGGHTVPSWGNEVEALASAVSHALTSLGI